MSFNEDWEMLACCCGGLAMGIAREDGGEKESSDDQNDEGESDTSCLFR